MERTHFVPVRDRFRRPEASSLKASWDPREKDEDRRASTQQESSSLINNPLEEGEISQL